MSLYCNVSSYVLLLVASFRADQLNIRSIKHATFVRTTTTAKWNSCTLPSNTAVYISVQRRNGLSIEVAEDTNVLPSQRKIQRIVLFPSATWAQRRYRQVVTRNTSSIGLALPEMHLKPRLIYSVRLRVNTFQVKASSRQHPLDLDVKRSQVFCQKLSVRPAVMLYPELPA